MKKSNMFIIGFLIVAIGVLFLATETTESIGDCYDELHNKIIGLECEVTSIDNSILFMISCTLAMILAILSFWFVITEPYEL